MRFVKRQPGRPAAAYVHEACGLAWLDVPGGCRVVKVRDVDDASLTLEYIDQDRPTAERAHAFGRGLAHMHAAGAPKYGSLPPGVSQGFIAELALPDGAWDTFGPFYAQARIAPFLPAIGTPRVFTDLIEALVAGVIGGPAEPPSRLHGDLWSGNVLWHMDGAVLIDPSAHGGHRETDLAMLALFGVPWFDDIIAGYESVAPLAEGWQRRQSLHQVYPLLVHGVLFGGAYVDQAVEAAMSALPD
jgi:fructosamine-3-kinase